MGADVGGTVARLGRVARTAAGTGAGAAQRGVAVHALLVFEEDLVGGVDELLNVQDGAQVGHRPVLDEQRQNLGKDNVNVILRQNVLNKILPVYQHFKQLLNQIY